MDATRSSFTTHWCKICVSVVWIVHMNEQNTVWIVHMNEQNTKRLTITLYVSMYYERLCNFFAFLPFDKSTLKLILTTVSWSCFQVHSIKFVFSHSLKLIMSLCITFFLSFYSLTSIMKMSWTRENQLFKTLYKNTL